MFDQVLYAISKGADVHASISGGKDGQAMLRVLYCHSIPLKSLIHADLGKIEWPQSLDMCKRMRTEYKLPLSIVTRTDKKGLIDRWRDRMEALKGKDKPFWSSSAARYCTSDLKRDPIDRHLRNLDNDFNISAEGIRSQESIKRAKLKPLSIRKRASSTYYHGMTVEQAIAAYVPGKRLSLTWYPIFNLSLEEVWGTYGMNSGLLQVARDRYMKTGKMVEWWPFHPAYVFGNNRVSCVFCVLADVGDLSVGAAHRPELLDELISMEQESGFTFRQGFTLSSLK